MLHHGGDGDGGHDQNGGYVELGHGAAEIGQEGLESRPAGGFHAGKVDQCRAAGGYACEAGDDRHQIGPHHAQQDGNDLHHALTPDIGHNDDGHSHQGQPPAGGGVAHGGGGQVQADEDDDGPGDHRGQEAHDLMHPHQLDQPRQRQVQEPGHHDAPQGVGQLFLPGHAGVDARVQFGHGGEAPQVGEGGTQEGGHLQLGAHMEEQGAQPGEKQGGLDGQGQAVPLDQDGHQHGGAKHGEHVLEAQDEHFGHAQGAGVADRSLIVHSVLSLFLCIGADGLPRAKKRRSPNTAIVSCGKMETARPQAGRFIRQRHGSDHFPSPFRVRIMIPEAGRDHN